MVYTHVFSCDNRHVAWRCEPQGLFFLFLILKWRVFCWSTHTLLSLTKSNLPMSASSPFQIVKPSDFNLKRNIHANSRHLENVSLNLKSLYFAIMFTQCVVMKYWVLFGPPHNLRQFSSAHSLPSLFPRCTTPMCNSSRYSTSFFYQSHVISWCVIICEYRHV